MEISVKRCVLGRPIARGLKKIIIPKDLDFGFGPGQVRPDGSRQPESEIRFLADRLMDLNGMSGQLND